MEQTTGEYSIRMKTNVLYWGDNLGVLRDFDSESIHLIYLDPPFNSKRDYNAIFRDETGSAPPAQIKAFTDTWKWHMAVDAYKEVGLPPENRSTLDARLL